MTQRARPRAGSDVEPSKRDPIEAWLDVFVQLLGLRGESAARVRDELEDHLRSRVDDLMIGGASEARAVRTAVAELGETGELARRWRSARRAGKGRWIVQSVIIAAAGGLVALGASGFLGGQGAGSGHATPAIDTERAAGDASAAPADEPSWMAATRALAEREITVDLSDIPVVGIDWGPGAAEQLRLWSLNDVLKALASAAGLETFRYAEGEEPWPQVREVAEPDVYKGTFEELVSRLRLPRSGRELGETYRVQGGTLVWASADGFDREDSTLRYYALHDIGPAGGDIRDLIAELLFPRNWETASYAGIYRIGFAAGMLAVKATPAVHERIGELLDRAREQHAETERRAANARLERLAELKHELAGIDGELRALEDTLQRTEERLRQARDNGAEAELGPLLAELREMSQRLEDVRAFREAVLQRIIVLRFGEIPGHPEAAGGAEPGESSAR